MARRNRSAWHALTPNYRTRLIRRLGDGDHRRAQAAYLRGESLKAARGKPSDEAPLRRQRGLDRGLTVSQAAGHPRPGEDPASAISRTFFAVPVLAGNGRLAGTRLVDLDVNAGQASRVGAYLADIAKLRAGSLGGAEFESRWQHRRIAGHSVEWRASRVVEILRQQEPPPGQPRYKRASRQARSAGRVA